MSVSAWIVTVSAGVVVLCSIVVMAVSILSALVVSDQIQRRQNEQLSRLHKRMNR